MLLALTLLVTAALAGATYLLWFILFPSERAANCDGSLLQICGLRVSASAVPPLSKAVDKATPDSPMSGVYGLKHGGRSAVRVTPEPYRVAPRQLPFRSGRSLFPTSSSDDQDMTAGCRVTPAVIRPSAGRTPSPSPACAATAPVEFTEVCLLGSEFIPDKMTPSRFTDVFVTPSSCDVSSPLREHMGRYCTLRSLHVPGLFCLQPFLNVYCCSSSDGLPSMDYTKHERERQAALVKRIQEKVLLVLCA